MKAVNNKKINNLAKIKNHIRQIHKLIHIYVKVLHIKVMILKKTWDIAKIEREKQNQKRK